MRKLDVYIEIDGEQRRVGCITGDTEFDAAFSYSEEHLGARNARPLSLSLPLREEPYSAAETRSFFEGLLPEGFLRRTVAENNRTDANDYLSLLELLGAECLGAIQIRSEGTYVPEPEYRPLDTEMMFRLAAEGATTSADLVVESHLSLTGASGKIGAYRDAEGHWFLPVGSAPSTHILKQSHIRYEYIVQNEQLALRTAKLMGISVPHSEIVESEVDDNRTYAGRIGISPSTEILLFATERYDRVLDGSTKMISGVPCPLRLHQEDFGQALGIIAADKYERPGGQYMRRMFDLIRRCSASPIEDQIKLWDMLVFHWLIGNTDGHIKNFSLLYDRNLRSLRLAPAYDIISTIVYDSHSSEMAIAIGDELKWNNIDRSCFEKATRELRLSKGIFMDRFDELNETFEPALTAAAGLLSEEGYSEATAIADKLKEMRK